MMHAAQPMTTIRVEVEKSTLSQTTGGVVVVCLASYNNEILQLMGYN